jgi:hypothetical protein
MAGVSSRRAIPRTTPRSSAPNANSSPQFARLAVLFVALVALAAILVSVTFRFFDYDLWEHLVVGKFIWATHTIPTTQLWTWPTYGQPAMIPSWLFRAVLWPFWHWGDVTGLFAWRWLTTLATFGLLFAAARRMNAAPITTLVVLALCALSYRGRTMVRPETLAYVLFAAEILILEARRHGGPRRDWTLVAIAWIWINTHVSFYLGLALIVFHALGSAWVSRSRTQTSSSTSDAWPLVRTGVACLAISFVNPFGWHAVIQPFQHVLVGRAEIVYRTVGELGPIDWSLNWKNGLPLLMLGWPALMLWRARRFGVDPVETLMCVGLSLQALISQRMRAFYALAAAPYVARDLAQWIEVRGVLRGMPTGLRAALASLAIVALGWVEWSLPQFPLGIGLDMRYYPVAACDFIERHGIRGHAFNHFWLGGYMEHRFWPDRDRLPFMDGHLESGTERDRTLYTRAQSDRDAWQALDGERRFDFALLDLRLPTGIPLRAFLEEDPTWALVFADDAAALFVRRTKALTPVADRFAYRRLRLHPDALNTLIERCRTDPGLSTEVRAELERQISESPYHEVARSILAAIE